jgi:hypothetical protein
MHPKKVWTGSSLPMMPEALEEAYESALDSAALEIFRGKYTAEEIHSMIDRADMLRMTYAKIEEQLQSDAP